MLFSAVPRADRRTVLIALVSGVGLAAAGCDAAPRAHPVDRPAPAPAPPDQALLDQAASAITSTLLAALATSQRHPRLTPRLEGFVAMHRAHLRALDRPDPTAAPDEAIAAVRPRAPRALREVGRRQAQLRGLLADSAGQAQSGSLARLLASMAAAIAQQQLSTGSGAD